MMRVEHAWWPLILPAVTASQPTLARDPIPRRLAGAGWFAKDSQRARILCIDFRQAHHGGLNYVPSVHAVSRTAEGALLVKTENLVEEVPNESLDDELDAEVKKAIQRLADAGGR